MHDDGTLLPAPIALAEAQGYAYAAYEGISRLFEHMGRVDAAVACAEAARRLKAQFNSDYWLEDESYFALALDGKGAPSRVVASNAAHCLWTGIIDERRSAAVASELVSERMFSGWGIRTLASGMPRYNPIGYHLGTVWPHDNSIAVMGLKRYGFNREAARVASALFDAAFAFPYFRLPELFGGQTRRRHSPPVPYPVACRPQSWAAGTLPYVVHAMLGLVPSAAANRIDIVAPYLPEWLGDVEVRGLRVGEGTVDLRYSGASDTTVEVLNTHRVDAIVHTP
jgi:glycogen debranching enzyme